MATVGEGGDRGTGGERSERGRPGEFGTRGGWRWGRGELAGRTRSDRWCPGVHLLPQRRSPPECLEVCGIAGLVQGLAAMAVEVENDVGIELQENETTCLHRDGDTIMKTQYLASTANSSQTISKRQNPTATQVHASHNRKATTTILNHNT